MHRHQWPTRPPAHAQDRESPAALVNTHSIRHNNAILQPSKPPETISALALSSDTATATATATATITITAAAAADSVSTRPNAESDNRDHAASENPTFTTASGPPAGIINPFDLSASKSSGPRHVLVRIDGDAGSYLSGIANQPATQDLDLPTEIYGSQSVTNGDVVQTGWTVDYYGLSRTAQGYGNGVGWRSQEAEALVDTQGGHYGWPRKFVCSLCSLRWNAVPLPGKVIRGDVSQKDRIDLRIPNPPDTRKDPTFSRPGCSEVRQGLHYYLDHEGSGNDPCVRGLCQTCRPISLLPDSQPTTHCCPPQVAEPGFLKEIYRCIMDNCSFLTDTRREMKAHLHSPRKNGHKAYLSALAARIEHGQPLSAVDKEVSSRLMLMFNDRDARGQKSISQPINTVLGPEDISSPAILREHTQWVSYLGLHTPELHRRDFFDPRTNQWYYREYNLDDDFEDACENIRIVSHATGRAVKASDFMWR
ncbi:hypothetical protein CPLU01_10073 [Colletotrichum plurivorum]|uniref:Uncharacterized protein n=1 Tax=Colletotrichum plurivorum TaxID=2175906 RepID=A0A8H6K6S4_9PEZI|nr:hypothetical protein CPLU01_10073 [Colletotrichum plurivorum]